MRLLNMAATYAMQTCTLCKQTDWSVFNKQLANFLLKHSFGTDSKVAVYI